MKAWNQFIGASRRLSEFVTEAGRISVFIFVCTLTLVTGYFISVAFGPELPNGLVVDGSTHVEINTPSRQKPVSHTFQLRNPTRLPIRIQSVNTGCTCLTTNLDSHEVLPKQRVNLEVTVFNFDATKASYREMINVVTNKNSIALQIHGDLPLPTAPLFRPKTVYMEPVVGNLNVERDVIVRVPKHLCRTIVENDVKFHDCESVFARLIEEHSTELFREFRITLVAPAEKCRTLAGRVKLETGCGLVDIELRGHSEDRP